MSHKLRNLLAVFVAALTALAVTPAFAATVTITTNNPNTSSEDPTYTYYKMMEASISDGGATSYYVENETLANAIDGLTVGTDDLFTVTKASGANRWNVEVNKKADGSDFTGEEIATALDTIKSNAIETGTATKTNDVTSFTIKGDGYVLVESSLGTKLVANTYGTPTITEKNTYPTDTKSSTVSNAEIGGTVPYIITVEIPANVAEKQIVVTDTMSDGLTMGTTVTASVDGTNLSGDWITWGNGTTGTDSKTTYTMTIPASVVKANAGKSIVISYSATVNENAVVNEPETNSSHLEYDNYKSAETPDVQVKTFGFDLTKVDGNNTETKLSGVKFTLTRTTDGTTYYYTPATDSENVNEARFGTTKTEVATDANGKITFEGLAQGEYTLTETETKDGYKLLTGSITVTIDANGSVTFKGDNAEGTGNSATVKNFTGTSLPSTGGAGTVAFTVVGATLVVAAGALLVTRKRMEK